MLLQDAALLAGCAACCRIRAGHERGGFPCVIPIEQLSGLTRKKSSANVQKLKTGDCGIPQWITHALKRRFFRVKNHFEELQEAKVLSLQSL